LTWNSCCAIVVDACMAADREKAWTFSDIAHQASSLLGSAYAFVGAGIVVAIWALTGPLFGYSDTWQLVINTGTTIVTFLMVFLVQHTQNRDARALHLKLDELLRSVKAARNRLIDLENCTDEEIDQIERQFRAVRKREQRKPVGENANAQLSRKAAVGK
jgi:low affinity Fe/Cu permease